MVCVVVLFNDTATTEIYTLSLHDALPICGQPRRLVTLLFGDLGADLAQGLRDRAVGVQGDVAGDVGPVPAHPYPREGQQDRKSTRLNSSHANISYAVFCLKKKKRRPECTT